MNTLLSYLKQPLTPSDGTVKNVIIIVSSVWVFLVLMILKPLNIVKIEYNVFLITLGFALITFLVCTSVLYLSPKIFRKFYHEKEWTLGKFLGICLAIVLLISVGNCAFDTLMGIDLIGLSSLAKESVFYALKKLSFSILITSLIGLFPMFFCFFILRYKFLQSNLDHVNQYVRSISKEKRSDSDNVVLLTLQGATKDKLTLPLSDLVYIEAAGNYISIFYYKTGKLVCKLLRTSISQMSNDLKQYSQIIRCHRGFIVNTDHILEAKKYQITLKNINQPIPVSRNCTKL